MATAAEGMKQVLTLSLQIKQSEEQAQRKSFEVEVTDDEGNTKILPVYIVPREELDGGLGEVNSQGEIFLRRGIPPVLVPILLQKLYYMSMGYADEQTTAAAILYGGKVLNPDDFGELLRLLGSQTTALAMPRSSEGSMEYYMECFSNYNENFRRNKWVSRARAYSAAGVTELAQDYGRGALIAESLLAEEALYRTEGDGQRVEVAPALREMLPEIVGSLENLAHMLRGQKGTVEVAVCDPALIRTLYLFTEEFVQRSPVEFLDGACALGEDVIRFRRGSDKLVESVLSHLRVNLEAERSSVHRVLTAAKKVYGELPDGTSYRAMIGAAAGLQGKSEDEVKAVVHEMEMLGRRRDQLVSSVVGSRENVGSATVRPLKRNR